MTSTLPEFDAPPVVETAMGVQFEQLPGLSYAHVGWYWRDHLGEDWTTVKHAGRLNDQFERFGPEKQWTVPGIKLQPGTESDRIQIARKGDDRLIQVQDTRFVYNWRKGTKEYPSYRKLLPEFQQRFGEFAGFIGNEKLGELSLNQWELTYVNHIPKGPLWETVADWPKLFPGLYVPAQGVPGQQLEGLSGEWRMVLGEEEGRLHVSIQHGRVGSAEGPEAVIFQQTARGPIRKQESADPRIGFEVGHKAIVQSFVAMTSEAAHEHWHRRA